MWVGSESTRKPQTCSPEGHGCACHSVCACARAGVFGGRGWHRQRHLLTQRPAVPKCACRASRAHLGAGGQLKLLPGHLLRHVLQDGRDVLGGKRSEHAGYRSLVALLRRRHEGWRRLGYCWAWAGAELEALERRALRAERGSTAASDWPNRLDPCFYGPGTYWAREAGESDPVPSHAGGQESSPRRKVLHRVGPGPGRQRPL